jgi:hypothetical protein
LSSQAQLGPVSPIQQDAPFTRTGRGGAGNFQSTEGLPARRASAIEPIKINTNQSASAYRGRGGMGNQMYAQEKEAAAKKAGAEMFAEREIARQMMIEKEVEESLKSPAKAYIRPGWKPDEEK